MGDVFHSCALQAYVDEAKAVGDWPDSEKTRQRAYKYYEQEKRGYQAFLDSKKHSLNDSGISVDELPSQLFDFQAHVTDIALKRGRCAVFLDTGLGKTIIQLTIAKEYVRHTNKPVLIITPLAVAFQFLKEAEKFGIDDIEYSKDGRYKSKIVVCNYERMDKFDSADFDCVLLDESSILKNFKGAIKAQITSFLKRVKYRYLFTATPSPNDFIEIGTSSEALGYMGYMDMLSKFFTNNEDTISPQKIGVKWTLKGHAERAFFEWVSGWSVSMRKPSDLGFSDKGFILPELRTNHHKVFNDRNLCIDGQHQLFSFPSTRLTEVREEQKATVEKRCEQAVGLVESHDTSVYWCNLNQEGDLLEAMDGNAVQLKGSMILDKKEEILLAFADGQIKKLITKPKITCFGLNWQHCNHTVYFPTFSYEQYYQAIRRFWRFGQKNPVNVDMVYSDGQEKVVNSLEAKAEKANQLFSRLNMAINSSYENSNREFNEGVKLPDFLGGIK